MTKILILTKIDDWVFKDKNCCSHYFKWSYVLSNLFTTFETFKMRKIICVVEQKNRQIESSVYIIWKKTRNVVNEVFEHNC